MARRSKASYEADTLEYYDARRDLCTIMELYKMVRTAIDDATAMKQLKQEALNLKHNTRPRMDEVLNRAMTSRKRDHYLTEEECLVIIMYTDNFGDKAFYKEFNEAWRGRRNLKDYRVYATLLKSAILKLAKSNPLSDYETLYRGIPGRFGRPEVSKIFWKTFTSTSLKREVAKDIAGTNGTIIEIEPSASIYGARIQHLSEFSYECEVLLLPFQAFDFRKSEGSVLYFSVSERQELLPEQESESSCNVQ